MIRRNKKLLLLIMVNIIYTYIYSLEIELMIITSFILVLLFFFIETHYIIIRENKWKRITSLFLRMQYNRFKQDLDELIRTKRNIQLFCGRSRSYQLRSSTKSPMTMLFYLISSRIHCDAIWQRWNDFGSSITRSK